MTATLAWAAIQCPVYGNCYGTSADNEIRGTDSINNIYAKGGSDLVYAHDSGDYIEGSDGYDRILGHAGHDEITGGENGNWGSDHLIGNLGNDITKDNWTYGDGNFKEQDRHCTADGADIIDAKDGDDDDYIWGGPGDDTVQKDQYDSTVDEHLCT